MNGGSKESAPQSRHAQIVNFEPRSEQERTRNQTIAKKIKGLLEKNVSSSNTTFTFIDLKLARKDPDFAFIILSFESNKEDLLPKDVSYPLYALALDNQARRFRNDDGKIYHAEIIYLFNEAGQGVQRLLIKQDSIQPPTASITNSFPHFSIGAEHINTPKFSTIKDSDFPRIGTLITRAKSGKWSKAQPLKPNTVIIAKTT